MTRLLNKNFFKFTFGFIGMIMFGLLGIIITGYIDSGQQSQPAAVEEIK
jgi:hypothetical protein